MEISDPLEKFLHRLLQIDKKKFDESFATIFAEFNFTEKDKVKLLEYLESLKNLYTFNRGEIGKERYWGTLKNNRALNIVCAAIDYLKSLNS